MENIIGFINNSWVISIVTGILVYLLTNWFNKIKDNKEYRRNINQVTSDVVIMLQEFIVENRLPDKDVLISYYTATCDKYGVNLKDADSLIEILDFLTKEILDSKFLNSKNKLEYCNSIEAFRVSILDKKVTEELVDDTERIRDKKKEELQISKLKRQVYFIISILISTITLMVLFYVRSDNNKLSILKPITESLTIMLGIVTLLVTIMSLIVFRLDKSRKTK